MYQTNTTQYTEVDFNQLMKIFGEEIVPQGTMSEDNEMWDMTSIYSPNHAAIWNRPQNIGKTCKILQKNNTMALVVFSDSEDKDYETLECLYRLEDLSIHNPQSNDVAVFNPNPDVIVHKLVTYNKETNEIKKYGFPSSTLLEETIESELGGWSNLNVISNTVLSQERDYVTTGITADKAIHFTIVRYSA